MFGYIFKKIFGSKNERYLRRLRPLVARINALEPDMQALADEDFARRMGEYRQAVQDGEKTLDELLPEVFALVREASRRVLGMRHYDVQLIGGMVLHKGKIAEMKTGEGKTLVATLPVALNALSGKGVHVVTVNDYLARRDAEWMGKLYGFLGLTTGIIVHGLDDEERKAAYAADITYGTNNEFGFDYLRDNMKFYAEQLVQRGHSFAIVDEVDSILIDEARTPLIISGPSDEDVSAYRIMDGVVRQLGPEHYTVDEKARTAMLTEEGVIRCEELLKLDNLFDPVNVTAQHGILQSLKAHHIFKRDKDYMVVDGQVVIVDEFTGRPMEGRRYSDGLHQALEAKEGVTVAAENQTLAAITFQNYFRLYDKLSGMTGTADTEAVEFQQIYGLEVVSIPPNRPMIRKDYPDLIYRSRKEKYEAILESIRELHKTGQPVLVGTISIETSEMLSAHLKRMGIPHNVLNAKQHEREAEIVAQAGQKGKVTIATNMAGRGTDIILGEGVRELGGLHILGTERHESRRIDNQLRGRSGRQGDPGVTQFYLSLEDDLMRLFGGDRMESIDRMMAKMKMPDDMPIQAGIVSKAIEGAQRQVETMHFAARKNVLEYDDVMNLQREAIYSERNAILDGKDLDERISSIIDDAVEAVVEQNCPVKTVSDEWDVKAVDVWAAEMTGRDEFDAEAVVDRDDDPAVLADELEAYLQSVYDEKGKVLGEAAMKALERQVMLRIIDTRWMAHLSEMDYLKTGIGLRAFGQRDPLVEYKNEAYRAFQNLTSSMYSDYLRTILRLQIATKKETPQIPEQRDPLAGKVSYSSPEAVLDAPGVGDDERVPRPARAAGGVPKQAPREVQKPQTYVKDKDDPFANVGRNDPCPCGSGLKFKKCHGKDL